MPDELWARVERWAALRGQETSDGLRNMLERAAEQAPATGIVVRPPMKWMLDGTYKHSCFQKRPRNPVNPRCDDYHHHLADWVFVRGPAGLGSWWDLYSSVTTQRIWHRGDWTRVPAGDLEAIALAFRGEETRIRVHHLMENEGPRLVTGPDATASGKDGTRVDD